MKGALLSGLAFIFLLIILVYRPITVPVTVREWSDRFYSVGNGTEHKRTVVLKGDISDERVAVEEVEADIVERQKVIDEKCRKYRSKWNKGRAFPYESRMR